MHNDAHLPATACPSPAAPHDCRLPAKTGRSATLKHLLSTAALTCAISQPVQALTSDEARHLLNRTGGANPPELAAYLPLSREAAADRLDKAVSVRRVNEICQLQSWWFQEMLTWAALRDSLMLSELDNVLNPRRHPNENLARELMELFTLGIGHYGEYDVKEVALVLAEHGAAFDVCCCENAASWTPVADAPTSIIIVSAADNSAARDSSTSLQWLSLNREFSLDRYGVTTDNGWLTAHYALADGSELEWRYGTLSTGSETEVLRGEMLGGEIAFPQARWLRKLDAAVYRWRGDYQWQGGMLFSLVKDHLDVQIQRNVFAWAQALWATKMAVAGNLPISAVKANFDYQYYKVSDGNTVHDASLGVDANSLLRIPRPVRIQLGIHQRWAKFNSPYYWSPSAADTTLGVEAGIAWERPLWQFSTSIGRNLALNNSTAPTWGLNASANFRITRTVSIGASYVSNTGAPRKDAYWRQYATVYVKVRGREEK